MNFLKSLFGSGQGQAAEDQNALYFYVRPKRCDEIVKVRVNLRNDLSLSDEGGYFSRKIVRGMRCPFAAELHLNFDTRYQLVQTGVQDGQLVEEAEYEAWLAAQG